MRWLDQWRQVSHRMCLSKNCCGRHLQHRSIPLRPSCNALHGRRKQSFGITPWLRAFFFQRELCGESLDFTKFRAWLSTKPLWTPLRVEWSLYNEDLKVCGQVDSLWFDLESNGVVVMADWKRARALLTSDEAELERQSFGKRGNSCCSHLHDIAWSHYLVQQTLYAFYAAFKIWCSGSAHDAGAVPSACMRF